MVAYDSWHLTLYLKRYVASELRAKASEREIQDNVTRYLTKIGYRISSVIMDFHAPALVIAGEGKIPLRDRIDALFTKI